MQQKYHHLTFFVLLSFVLSACMSREVVPVAQVPTVEAILVATAVPTKLALTETPLPLTPTATAVPDNTPTPINQAPVIITSDFTNVRLGPGLAYEVSHVLKAGTTNAILGRDDTGSWWAVSGAVSGSRLVGWVSDAVVTTQGNLSHVPILETPPLMPDIPTMGNASPFPTDDCTVAQPGLGDTGPLFIYAGPAKQTFAVVAQLGLDRWVTVIGRDNDWYHVQDDAGLTGWVPVAEVAHPGLCQPNDGPGSIPLIEEPGSPPTDLCLAHRRGQFPPPDVYSEPGRQFALIARLGNWAEVLKTGVGWHQILFSPGEVGWVNADDVELTGPCTASDAVPERIQFAPGETSITLEGMLESSQRDFYLFRALTGQRTVIEIVSESNRANFAVSGMGDGQPYKRVEDELHSWSIELPVTQDYMLMVAVPVGTPTTGYRIFLTIDPLEIP